MMRRGVNSTAAAAAAAADPRGCRHDSQTAGGKSGGRMQQLNCWVEHIPRKSDLKLLDFSQVYRRGISDKRYKQFLRAFVFLLIFAGMRTSRKCVTVTHLFSVKRWITGERSSSGLVSLFQF